MVLRRKKTSDVSVDVVPFEMCPAKTWQVPGSNEVRPGRNVLEHCHIVGTIAQKIIELYPPALQSLFPEGAPLGAAGHDAGKVSPTFYENRRRNFTAGADHLPVLDLDDPTLEREWGGHAGVSQAAVKAMGAPKWVPEVLGQHHGFSPSLGGRTAESEVFGGHGWQQQRVALVQALKQRLSMDWPQLQNPSQARLLAGLTCVADWIGSGEHFEDPSQPWEDQIDKALQESGWVSPNYQSNLCFSEVFGFSPNHAQQQLLSIATIPGVYTLEAPMGWGKTEAALYVAYQMLQSGQASGIYFALPTQLTSNKIYERFNAFLKKILAADCPHRSALLLHGKSWLQDTSMGEEGRPGGAWFNSAKRGLLAPFAVGTIDQALMASMNVKHGFVRAFGLAGKVVILDEVHTYDAYTGTLLDALVALLRQLGCTVIVLSATLNQERRADMLDAEVSSMAYPLLTAVQGKDVKEYPIQPPPAVTVLLHHCKDPKLALQEAIDRASQGQQVLWIENTVVDAQERYLDLASRAKEVGVDCGLLHSRLTAQDRQAIESKWVTLFGKEGYAQRGNQGRILVGTQALEQSLNIDADFEVTAFAPTDMIFQRMGREWRFEDTPRPVGARREVWILEPDLTAAMENPYSAFGPTAHVYAPYVLCRSLEVWQTRQSVTLPTDIRPMIEDTYTQRTETGFMATWLHELDEGRPGSSGQPRKHGRKAMRQLANFSLAEAGKTRSDVDAPTRYSETDNYEVLLLRSLHFDPNRQMTRLGLLDGSFLELPVQRHRLGKKAWRQLAVQLMQQQVPVPGHLAPAAVSREQLQKLGFGNWFHLGNPDLPGDESMLRLALVDENGFLQGLHGATASEQYILEYRSDLGYRHTKIKK